MSMNGIPLRDAEYYFREADTFRRDGVLNATEIADAALTHTVDRAVFGYEADPIGSFWTTLLVGGTDTDGDGVGEGLYPDFNGDQQIDLEELRMLASQSGRADMIEASDFESVWGASSGLNRYMPGGGFVTESDIDRLIQYAEGSPSPVEVVEENPAGIQAFDFLQQFTTFLFDALFGLSGSGGPFGGVFDFFGDTAAQSQQDPGYSYYDPYANYR